MQAEEKGLSATSKDLIYDIESQSSSKLQRTREAIGDRTALIIVRHGRKLTTLSCETLGIKYEFISATSWLKNQTDTRITRQGPKDTQSVLVAEWVLKSTGTDKLRLESSESPKDFIPAKSYLQRIGWFIPRLPFYSSFVVQGKTYIWKAGVWSLKLYREGTDEAIATTFNGKIIYKSRFGFIEIPPYEDILDELVVTWAIVVQRRNERHALLSILHTLLFDGLVMTLLHVFVWDRHHS